MDEIFEITEFVQEEAGYGTDLIWGNCFDESLGDKVSVTIIATGFEHRNHKEEMKPGEEKIVVSLDDEQEKKSSLYDLGHSEEKQPSNAKTVEFDDIRASFSHMSHYSYEEPYVKQEDKERMEMERRRRYEYEMQRREKERSRISPQKLSNPRAIHNLENEPAYLRRRVYLDDVPNSADPGMSKWTISDEDEPEIRAGNSFLHDNVD